MSIFKVKPWWSNTKLLNEENVGLQNASCLRVDKFGAHNDSDCLVVGEGTLLKVYKPTADQEVSHTILESDLGEIVLQLDTGKFIVGYEDRQIIVLHPHSYAIYQLKRKEGHTDAGDQNQLQPVTKHSFTRRADSLICGSFGNIKTRDFICIQGLDGSLSFFDQSTFLFMCIFNDVIIPGPVAYVSNSDTFVVCKSTWIMEIYSYQQLRELSELTARQNKNNIPQWAYNAGEEITHLQVIQTSSNFSSILALGERHLYCFQDNGLMKYVIKFECMPICFNAFLIGWYFEAGARLLVTVASEDSKLFVYEGTSLLWSCDLLTPAISISRCFLKGLPGGLVTLSPGGIVNVGFMGTEPDLNANVTQTVNEQVDMQQVQAEMEEVEETLQNILENKDDTDSSFSAIENILKIKADVGKPVQNLFQETTQNKIDGIHLLMCPVIVILNCEDPKLIQSMQITYACCPPFECSESTICLDNVNGSEIIETQVFLASEYDISETRIKILFTITDSSGKIGIITKSVLLPLSLFCYPVEVVTENKLKLCVEGNRPCIELSKIFTDFTEEDLKLQDNPDTVTFVYRSTKRAVTIATSQNQYIIQADEFTEMSSILDHFILRLNNHHKRMGTDFKFKLIYDKEFVKQVMQRFFRIIEAHAKERLELKTAEDELNILQRQFMIVQKRLLVQYGSLPPGECDPLEFLMRDTHKRIVDTVNLIIEMRENVCRAGSSVSSIGHFIVCILKQITEDEFKIKLIEEMMTLACLYEHYQEWEEAVSQALSYIWNNVFKKSEKDKEKLAPVMEQAILSQINLKRFLKQLRIVLDNLFFEDSNKQDNQITRIEELVEVL